MTAPTTPKASGLAVTSAVCGFAGLLLGFLTGIPAIITGHLAQKKIRLANGTVGGQGLATTGLIMGYITSALSLVVLALAALATPAIFKALEKANRAQNMSNVKQLQVACQMYAMDNEGRFPPSLTTLEDEDFIYDLDSLRFKDPESKTLYNWTYFEDHSEADPVDTILIAAPIPEKSGSRRLVGFLDGSAKLIPENEYQQKVPGLQAAEASP